MYSFQNEKMNRPRYLGGENKKGHIMLEWKRTLVRQDKQESEEVYYLQVSVAAKVFVVARLNDRHLQNKSEPKILRITLYFTITFDYCDRIRFISTGCICYKNFCGRFRQFWHERKMSFIVLTQIVRTGGSSSKMATRLSGVCATRRGRTCRRISLFPVR